MVRHSLNLVLLASLLALAGTSVTRGQEASSPYVFENLGRPMDGQTLPVLFTTHAPDGSAMAWAEVISPDQQALVGIVVSSGAVVEVDLNAFGRSNLETIADGRGHLYLYSGQPGHFLKYDIAGGQLTDLGVPAENASYWIGHAVDDRGRFYVGSYPGTHLVVCDPATDSVRDLGPMAEDPKQKYLINPVAGPDGVIYCPVGLHHAELWAYDTRTGGKKQILPKPLTDESGRPSLWRGEDGRVYGRVGKKTFLCQPERVVMDQTAPEATPEPRNLAGSWHAIEITGQGQLRLKDPDAGEQRLLETPYPGAGIKVYSVGDVRGGYLYGGGYLPAHLFRVDLRNDRSEDLGRVTYGRIQVYDVLHHERGLFLSSYIGANLDLFDPDRPRQEGENPRHIATLQRGHDQERARRLVLGPDGNIYTGTTPIKGHLGGALARIDPKTLEVKVWRNVVPNQSCMDLVPIEATGEMLVTTSVGGGSSAIPTEKEAVLFFWDCQQERVTGQLKPAPGATNYPALVVAGNGIIYGAASDGRFFALDPKTRRVLHTGQLPCAPRWQAKGLLDRPVGERGLIYGIGQGGELFTLDPATHQVNIVARHPSLEEAHGATITPDGTLYYGHGSNLMRCRLPER